MTQHFVSFRRQFKAGLYHKFNATKTVLDGIRFDSKKEARYYQDLLLRQKAENGDVLFFLRQIAFYLPGGVRYVCDFQVFKRDGSVSFVDVKGFKTREYMTKKKLVESLYPVQIEEV
jgi:hypothetical protein